MTSIAAHIVGTRLVAPRQTVAAVILSVSDLWTTLGLCTKVNFGVATEGHPYKYAGGI